MNEFQVWVEGFAMNGEQEGARYLGTYEAETFAEACTLAVDKNFSVGGIKRHWDQERLTWFGCHMYDNGNDAVKSFG